MAKQKKTRKKYRGFWIFFKVQLILLVLIAAATGYYFAGGYAHTIAQLKPDAHMLLTLIHI